MLGLGWSEMLVISVVVLIVVGPKDLPMMLRNLGRMMGSVRKMSNEFRREIDKAIALDEVKEAQKAITDPLRQTSDEIAREFNTLKNGKYAPSGKLKPSDPDKESVAAEIRKQAGLPEKSDAQSKAAESIKEKVRAQHARLEAKKQAAAEPAATAEPASAKKVTAARRKPAARSAGTKNSSTKVATGKASRAQTAEGSASKASAASKPKAASRKKAPAKKAAPASAKAEAGSGDQ